MTRINAGISPIELCDQHLIAEYRELPRVRALAIRHCELDTLTSPVESFRLGKGHVLFFIDKGQWLENRWRALKEEMQFRDFNCTLEWRPWPSLMHNQYWQPNDSDIKMLKVRIRDRLNNMKRQPTWTKRLVPEWV